MQTHFLLLKKFKNTESAQLWLCVASDVMMMRSACVHIAFGGFFKAKNWPWNTKYFVL